LALSLLMLLAAWARPGWAGEDPAARSLFEEGTKLMDAGHTDEACPKFEESVRLQPSVGAELNLARCHELQGKTATAWTEYRRAAALAKETLDPKREELATSLANGLENKLPKLVITVPRPVDGIHVTRDGTEVGKGSWGTPLAADPGDHTIEASAPGHTSWTTRVHLPAAAKQEKVEVPELPIGESVPAAGDSSGTLRTAGIVVGATGLAITVVGVVLGGLVLSDKSNAQSDPTLCPNKQCTAEGRKVIDGAQSKATAASVLVPVGGASLLAGIILLAVAGASGPEVEPAAEGHPAAAARILPAIGQDNVGLFVVGTF